MVGGSVSSEDETYSEERCGSYSLSADISESESSGGFSYSRRNDPDVGVSSSNMASLSSPIGIRPVVGNCSFPAPPALFLPVIGGRDVVWSDNKSRKSDTDFSDIELMKERFAKLLLGEDMSGGGKGVCTALAISNAITNLAGIIQLRNLPVILSFCLCEVYLIWVLFSFSFPEMLATVFGDLWRLEPLAPMKKRMWYREMEWLLCVSESIVELVPSIQEFPGGSTFEIMATRPRADLYVNLPALKKLDAMLLNMLDGFRDTEFWYADRDVGLPDSDDCDGYRGGRPSVRQEDKWWLPCPKVPPNGLSDDARKKLQQCRDCANQILKAALAINSSVLAEMEIPSSYLEALPKNGKDCLGETIYRYITAEQFKPEHLLDCLDLSSEHHTLEVANRVEAAVHVWKQKDQRRHPHHSKSKKSTWGGKVKGLVTVQEKNQVLSHRAETLLRSLKLRFPNLPQTALDMSKIQYNKDVGQAILESYSRVTESLAFNIMARIDDVVYVDDIAKQSSTEPKSLFGRGGFGSLPIQKRLSPSPFSIQHTPYASPFATPKFCFSPVTRSPVRGNLDKSHLVKASEDLKLGRPNSLEYERVWSHPGNLSARKSSGDAPERD